MSIHHRTYTRIPLALDVELQFQGQHLGQALTRDINHFGAFIEIPKHELGTNDFIKIYFTPKGKDDFCVEQKGLVKHFSEQGVGVIFATETDEFKSLLDLEISDENKH